MMRLVVFLPSVLAVLALPSPQVFACAPPPTGLGRCGAIFIVGNDSTSHSFILDQVAVYPGVVFFESDLDAIERRLAATRLFRPGPNGRYVSLLHNLADPDSPYRDVQITVKERPFTPLLWAAAEGLGTHCTWPVQDLGRALALWAAETLVGGVSDGLAAWFPETPATSPLEISPIGAPPCPFDVGR